METRKQTTVYCKYYCCCLHMAGRWPRIPEPLTYQINYSINQCSYYYKKQGNYHILILLPVVIIIIYKCEVLARLVRDQGRIHGCLVLVRVSKTFVFFFFGRWLSIFKCVVTHLKVLISGIHLLFTCQCTLSTLKGDQACISVSFLLIKKNILIFLMLLFVILRNWKFCKEC